MLKRHQCYFYGRLHCRSFPFKQTYTIKQICKITGIAEKSIAHTTLCCYVLYQHLYTLSNHRASRDRTLGILTWFKCKVSAYSARVKDCKSETLRLKRTKQKISLAFRQNVANCEQIQVFLSKVIIPLLKHKQQ